MDVHQACANTGNGRCEGEVSQEGNSGVGKGSRKETQGWKSAAGRKPGGGGECCRKGTLCGRLS